MYRLKSCLFLFTVRISDVPCGMCCFCAQNTFRMYRLESIPVHIHISDVPSGKCPISVHNTHFCSTLWNVFRFCAQYTFLLYRVESVVFLCTVHISDVPSRTCSVSVHSTHFWCPITWYLLSNRSLVHVSCCYHCFLLILPWWRQFQSLSKQVTAGPFLMNVTDTNSWVHICLRQRCDVVG